MAKNKEPRLAPHIPYQEDDPKAWMEEIFRRAFKIVLRKKNPDILMAVKDRFNNEASKKLREQAIERAISDFEKAASGKPELDASFRNVAQLSLSAGEALGKYISYVLDKRREKEDEIRKGEASAYLGKRIR